MRVGFSAGGRETDPFETRVDPTPSMVLRQGRSRTRGGRCSAAIPDVEMRPETDTRPEPEIDNPAEIQVFMSAICEGGLGAIGLCITETAIQYVTADKPYHRCVSG